MATSSKMSSGHPSDGPLSIPFLLTYAAMASWGTWAFLTKVASRDLSGGGLKVWVFFGQTAATLIILTVIRFQVRWHVTGSICALLSGFLGSVADLALYAAFRNGGPASILIPLSGTAPAVTVILAVSFLRERLRKRDAAAVILAIIAGILLST